MKFKSKEITTGNGEQAIEFFLINGESMADGLYDKKDRIYIHTITARGHIKEFLNFLTEKFKTNLITFTPLMNDNIKNSIRGTIKICEASDPTNPYGEDFEYMECKWERN